MKPFLVGETTFVHESKIRVRFCETDANRHVSQVSYAIYFEQARTDFFDSLATDHFDWWSDRYSLVLAQQCINYLVPAHYRQTLRIVTGVSAIGRSSMGLYHWITPDDDGPVMANQASTVVLVDAANQKSHPWPEEFRRAVAPLVTAQP